jgi:hypothetical protein
MQKTAIIMQIPRVQAVQIPHNLSHQYMTILMLIPILILMLIINKQQQQQQLPLIREKTLLLLLLRFSRKTEQCGDPRIRNTLTNCVVNKVSRKTTHIFVESCYLFNFLSRCSWAMYTGSVQCTAFSTRYETVQ